VGRHLPRPRGLRQTKAQSSGGKGGGTSTKTSCQSLGRTLRQTAPGQVGGWFRHRRRCSLAAISFRPKPNGGPCQRAAGALANRARSAAKRWCGGECDRAPPRAAADPALRLAQALSAAADEAAETAAARAGMAPLDFVPVVITDQASARAGAIEIEVAGVRVRVLPGVDRGLLADVLRTLKALG
jgi:hypothetical protein